LVAETVLLTSVLSSLPISLGEDCTILNAEFASETPWFRTLAAALFTNVATFVAVLLP
jgi:hypothetical protein